MVRGAPAYPHEALAVVAQVRDGMLCVLVWQRAQPPAVGRWALPGGVLGASETLEDSIRRHLAVKVDVGELSHLEQLATYSQPRRYPAPRRLATAYLGLVPAQLDPAIPPDTEWQPVDALPAMAFDHAEVIAAGNERLRAKLSYTNLGFALAPPSFTISELQALYSAALGYAVSATNLQRVLMRRGLLEPVGSQRRPGPSGGRPSTLYRFRDRRLKVTHAFAVLRPPKSSQELAGSADPASRR